MDTEYEPVINNWYQRHDDQLHFCIIDIDETTGILNIQHANGDLDTMEIDHWSESDIEIATDPKNDKTSSYYEDEDDGDIDEIPTVNEQSNWQSPYVTDTGLKISAKLFSEEDQPDELDERLFLRDWEEDSCTVETDTS